MPTTLVMLAGVGTGSFAWMTFLSLGMNRLRRRLGERSLRVADGLAGFGMVGFGGVLAFRTLRQQ